MEELLSGVYRWELPHPEWTPEDAEGGLGWEEAVASYLVETEDGPVLVDPLVGEEHRDALDRVLDGRPPHVLITILWHTRSAPAIADRYPGTVVWAHEPAADLIRERGAEPRLFLPGGPLPGAIEAIDVGRAFEVAYFLRDRRALIVGDVLLGTPDGRARLFPPSWLLGDYDAVRTGLRASLGRLPVDHLLLTHGAAVLDNGGAAVAEALA
ncbi:MAG TPA: MBL fold metallo-hydrolase [Gaiellaceae bacterium]|nr:MBL fold metallo-hydrolase [Gaiellaceae bacterium]